MSVDLKASTLVPHPDQQGTLTSTIASPYGINELLEVSSRMAFDLVAFLASVSEEHRVCVRPGVHRWEPKGKQGLGFDSGMLEFYSS